MDNLATAVHELQQVSERLEWGPYDQYCTVACFIASCAKDSNLDVLKIADAVDNCASDSGIPRPLWAKALCVIACEVGSVSEFVAYLDRINTQSTDKVDMLILVKVEKDVAAEMFPHLTDCPSASKRLGEQLFFKFYLFGERRSSTHVMLAVVNSEPSPVLDIFVHCGGKLRASFEPLRRLQILNFPHLTVETKTLDHNIKVDIDLSELVNLIQADEDSRKETPPVSE